MKPAVAALSLLLASSLAIPEASSQPTPEDRAVAETLFQEARRLMDEKRYPAACPKLEEAQRIAPAGGTLLNLAACHEAIGRVAAAWAEFRDAETQAKKAGRSDREKIARERSAALAPLVPKLVIVVPPELAAQAPRITRDGTEIGAAAWGLEIPLDPGPHVLRAAAAGRVGWETRVELELGTVARVTIPLLEAEPAAPAPASPVPPPSPPPTSAPPPTASAPPVPESLGAARTAGWALTGAGATSFGIGVYFGVHALSKRADSDFGCTGSLCTPAGYALNEDARSAARASNLTLLLGVALASGGVALVLTAPTRATEVSIAVPGTLRVRW